VKIPDVANQDQAAATTALQQAGFQVQAVSTPSDTVPKGTVIGTDPSAGTLTPKGTVVNLKVSSGPDLVDVPNVVGQPKTSAEQTLLGAGFGVSLTCVVSPQNANRVISQSPSSGQAKRGSTVAISVGLPDAATPCTA
jgi:serine/threonine-protein kinase